MIIHTFGYTLFKMITHILEYGIIMMRNICSYVFPGKKKSNILLCYF